MLAVVAVLVGIVAGALGSLGVAPRRRAPRGCGWPRNSGGRCSPTPSGRPTTTRREAQIEAREQAVRLRAEIASELQDSRVQIAKVEERVSQRETELEAKQTELARREQGISDREAHSEAAPGRAQAREGRVAERAPARLGPHAQRGEAAGARALRGPRPARARAQRPPARGGGTVAMRSAGRARSSPTRCSASRRATRPRRR